MKKYESIEKMNKDMLFYSNYCQYCKDIINIITKRNLREYFICVCIDTNKYKIPPCVTHVPTIITRNKEVISDVQVNLYIDRLANYNANPVEDIAPLDSIAGGYSSSYTLLSQNGYDNEGTANETCTNNFCALNMYDYRINTPNDDNASTNGTKASKFDDSMYERYLNSRNADDEVLKRTVRR